MNIARHRLSRTGLLAAILAVALSPLGCNDQYADVGQVDLSASKKKAAELGVEKGSAPAPKAKKGGRPTENAEKTKGR